MRGCRTCRSRRKAARPIRGCARTSSSGCSPTARCARCSTRRWSVGDLVRFHTAHKLTLMAHSPAAYRELGRLVADAPRVAARASSPPTYEARLHGGAGASSRRRGATPTCCSTCSATSRSRSTPTPAPSCSALIEEHRHGLVPLVVPMTLMRHHVRRQQVAYLAGADLPGAASARAEPAQPCLIQAVPISSSSTSIPEWQKPLFAALERRGVSFEPFDLTRAAFSNVDAPRAPLYFNQASPSAYVRGNTRGGAAGARLHAIARAARARAC